MPFINYRAKENTKRCEDCKLNLVKKYKADKNGYLNILELDDKIAKIAAGLMWTTCKVCPFGKDFENVYGITPMEYFATAKE